MVKTLVFLFAIQGSANIIENRWDIYDQYFGQVCEADDETARLILYYPQNKQMCYIQKI